MEEELNKKLLEKEIENYNFESINYKKFNEIMVQITLKEYRELIQEKATKNQDIERAEKDKYTREDENIKFKEEIKRLNDIIFEYRKQFGELQKEEED